MKIALVILHTDPARGGAERYTVDIAQALVAVGHEVTLISSSFPKSWPADLRQIHLKLRGPAKSWRYWQFLNQLDAHLRLTQYDVVHAMLPVRKCDVYHPHAGLALAALREGHRKRAGWAGAASWFFNQLNPRRRLYSLTEQHLLTGAHPPLTICLSAYVKASILRHYPQIGQTPSGLDKRVTLMNAVNLKKYNPANRPEARSIIRSELGLAETDVAALIVAQDFERKGLRETIEAIAFANLPNLHLLVVGRDNPAPYKALAATLKVQDLIHFIGPTTDVYAYYRSADFFVLPTRHDPCSLVVLEALAMGLPVISTQTNGATEAMQQGINGLILPYPFTSSELAAALAKLTYPATRTQMATACLRTRQRLSFDWHLEGLMGIYKKVVQSAKNG